MGRLPIKIEVEQRSYFNFEFKKWVEDTFQTKEGQKVAWDTYNYLRQRYPETSQYLRGELVSSSQDIIYGGNNGSNQGSD